MNLDDVEIPDADLVDPPEPWTEVSTSIKGRAFVNRTATLADGGGPVHVIASVETHDGADYLHVSVSRPAQLPEYSTLRTVKRVFVGPERQAVEVHPPADEHRDCHPRTRHLWAALEGRMAPESFAETVAPEDVC